MRPIASALAGGSEPTDCEITAPISSGIRWTLWLSLLALPFSYGTNILLARIGPEALGTFGVLNVYIGLVFVFFLVGGCAVPMKFLPELDTAHRSSFLASYALIIVMSLVPWVIVATWRPQLLRFLFGSAGNPTLQLRLIYLSPICLAYLIMITSLKGLLEMKWAQLLDRFINFGQLAILLIAIIVNTAWLKEHAAEVVWLSYIGLTLFVALVAFGRLLSIGAITGWPRFWLPSRFWAYTLMLHTSSIVNFLSARLDYIFILNSGGLAVLGQYVAITSIAGIIPRISGFVVDSLLPSLTNCFARGDLRGASQVAETYLRIMFPAVLALCVGIAVSAHPVLAMMGPQYRGLASLLPIASFGAAVQSLSLFTNAVFTATDRVQDALVATAIRMAVFAASFWPLWTSLQLRGALMSWVLGEAAYHVASLYRLQKKPMLQLQLRRNYIGFIIALAGSVVLARGATGAESFTGVLVAGIALVAFLSIARYTTAEVRRIAVLLTTDRSGLLGPSN